MKRILSVLFLLCVFLMGTSIYASAEEASFEVSETDVTIKGGKTHVVTIHMEANGEIVYEAENQDICTGKWSPFKDHNCDLTLQAVGAGKTTIIVYRSDSPEVTKEIEVTVTPSDAEINQLKKVTYIGDDRFFDYENGGYFALQFALMDKDEKHISAPVTVDVKIVNDNDEVVYEKQRYVTSADFGTWTTTFGDRYVSTIVIPPEDIIPGTSKSGAVYYTAYQSGYISFPERKITTSELPKIELTGMCSLDIPDLPVEIDYNSSSGKLYATTRVTEMSYEFTESSNNEVKLTMKFTGEKTYDEKGEGHSSACHIGWKLYDSDDYVIDSGTCLTSSVEQGEKFKNSEEVVYNLKPDNYRLKLIDVE